MLNNTIIDITYKNICFDHTCPKFNSTLRINNSHETMSNDKSRAKMTCQNLYKNNNKKKAHQRASKSR